MRPLRRLAAFARADVPLRDLDPFRSLGFDAYELVDELPRGPARAAAWNAYVLQIYADKLVSACTTGTLVRADTADRAENIYRHAGLWVDRARRLAADPDGTSSPPVSDPLPQWHTPVRSQDQLAGMRETLDALHVYLAFDLQSFPAGDEHVTELRGRLAAVETKLTTVAGLWIPRAPAELRGGIGTVLVTGLDEAYVLGQDVARLGEATR